MLRGSISLKEVPGIFRCQSGISHIKSREEKSPYPRQRECCQTNSLLSSFEPGPDDVRRACRRNFASDTGITVIAQGRWKGRKRRDAWQLKRREFDITFVVRQRRRWNRRINGRGTAIDRLVSTTRTDRSKRNDGSGVARERRRYKTRHRLAADLERVEQYHQPQHYERDYQQRRI